MFVGGIPTHPVYLIHTERPNEKCTPGLSSKQANFDIEGDTFSQKILLRKFSLFVSKI
jgi:hypothetical protein